LSERYRNRRRRPVIVFLLLHPGQKPT
jgi:hypothetical protein